ncbi:uncharacterized protein LOC103794142 [Callithrix jacchus]
MRQRPPHDTVITICLSPSPRSQALGVSGGDGDTGGSVGRGVGVLWDTSGGRGGEARRSAPPPRPRCPSLVPPAPGLRTTSRSATKALPGSNITIESPSVVSDTPAGVFVLAPSPCAKAHAHAPTHSSLSIPGAKTSPSRCSPAPGRSRLARRPLAHLIQAVDFLRGIHDFSATGALGVHDRSSRGRRWRLQAPRSRCDIPRRFPNRLRAGGRAVGGRRRVESRRRAPGECKGRAAGSGAWGPPRSRGSRALGLGCYSGSAPLGLRRSHFSQGHPHPRLTDVPGTHRSRGVRGQGASSFLLLRVKPGTAAPSPRAEAASAALSDAPRPGSLEIRGEPGDPRPRGAGGCAAPAPTGLFREDANSACPREVLGSWMGKSSLTGSQTPHFLTSVLAETGHFRPESSLS